MDLNYVNYSDKSIVVRGNTKERKEDLKKLGGKYNANLQGGSGWIFSKKNEDKIKTYISSGKINLENNSENKHSADSETILSFPVILMTDIEKHIKTLDFEGRVQFISDISNMTTSLPINSKESSKPRLLNVSIDSIPKPLLVRQNGSMKVTNVESDEEESSSDSE